MLSLKKKGLVASFAALAMAVGGLGIGAGVANAEGTADITLTNATKGHTYTAYKLGKYATVSADSLSVVKASDDASAAVSAAAAASDPALTVDGNDAVSWAASLGTGSADLRLLVGSLENTIASSAVTADANTGELAATADTTLTVTGGEGWYLIVDSYTKDGAQTYGVGALVGTQATATDGTVIDKISKDGTDFPLGTVNVKPDDNGDGDPTADPKKIYKGSLAADGTAEFVLTSNGPTFDKAVKYSKYDYKFVDTPQEITVKLDTLKVYVGSTLLTKGTDYIVTAADGSEITADTTTETFNIDMSKYFTSVVATDNGDGTFTSKGDVSAESGKKIEISYVGQVDKGSTDAKNEFYIDDNGHKITDPNTNTDNNKGVTAVSFKKVGLDNTTGLAGATFTMTPQDDTSTPDIDESKSGVVLTATSDDKGVVKFEKIGAGKYTLTETAAPDGYIIAPGVNLTATVVTNDDDDAATGSVTFADEATPNTDMVTLLGNNGKATDSINADGSDASLKNVQNLAQLPLTGAYGIALFLILAVILAGGATIMVSVSKHNKKAGMAL